MKGCAGQWRVGKWDDRVSEWGTRVSPTANGKKPFVEVLVLMDLSLLPDRRTVFVWREKVQKLFVCHQWWNLVSNHLRLKDHGIQPHLLCVRPSVEGHQGQQGWHKLHQNIHLILIYSTNMYYRWHIMPFTTSSYVWMKCRKHTFIINSPLFHPGPLLPVPPPSTPPWFDLA